MVLKRVFLCALVSVAVMFSGCVTPESFCNATLNDVKVYKMKNKQDGKEYYAYLYFVKPKLTVGPSVTGFMVYDGPNGKQYYYQIDGINIKVIQEVVITIDGKETKLPLSVLGQTSTMTSVGQSMFNSTITTCTFECPLSVVAQHNNATAITLAYGQYADILVPKDVQNIARILQ